MHGVVMDCRRVIFLKVALKDSSYADETSPPITTDIGRLATISFN